MLSALRNGKELALEMGFRDSMGFALFWLENTVLEYSVRPDGLSITDCIKDPLVPAFRFVQHTRELCFERLGKVFSTFSHFGNYLPTKLECSAHQIPQVVRLSGLRPLSR